MAERDAPVRLVLDESLPAETGVAPDRLASLPFVVLGIDRGIDRGIDAGGAWLDLCDVVVTEDDPARAPIERHLSDLRITATALALLLRGQPRRSVDDGLVAESATYSVLQAGPEFAAWRAAHPPRADRDPGVRVRTERHDDTLVITLARPQRLNALDAQMRDELVDALAVAAADPGLTRVELRGEGRAFCAGGDLDEFGTRPDPATAHLVRLQRSVARSLAWLEAPTVTYLHGACMGSGIELAALTDWVIAAEDTQIALPEIGLGLVPGAGGTVSLPRRIGRLRTAWLAFSGCAIDAPTARDWGLVDEIAP